MRVQPVGESSEPKRDPVKEPPSRDPAEKDPPTREPPRQEPPEEPEPQKVDAVTPGRSVTVAPRCRCG